MFCTKCGAINSDEAVYCQKCGTILEVEEETRIARPKAIEHKRIEHFEHDDSEDNERQIFTISPTLVFVKIGYALAILSAFVLVFLLSFVNLSAWISVFAGLSLLLIPAYFHLKHKLVSYTLTDAKIAIDQGLISHTTRNVPLRTIQDVTVTATVPQRLLGFGDLIIENAGENDSRIVLKNINSPKKYADVLLKQMRRLNR